MKRIMQGTAALALSFTMAACAGDRSPDTEDNTVPGTVGTSGAAEIDREFVEEQIAMGRAEIELGRLAQERAMHADVKEYGAMMVRDHQMAADELRQVAAQPNATSPAGTTGTMRDDHAGDHAEALEELRELSGREFDRAYMERMVDDHQEAVRELERKAEGDANPQVQQWASKTLPKIREHLERAKSIKETLDRSGQ